MIAKSTFCQVGLALTLIAMITACTESADRMSGAALPQEAPSVAAGVGSGAVASDTVASAPESADVAALPETTGASEAVNPWGALAVPADQVVDDVTAAPVAVETSAAPAAADAAAPEVVGGAVDMAAAERPAPMGLPSTGSPAACQTLLKPIDDALKAGSGLILAITIMPANGAYVGYAEGEVKRVAKAVAVGSPARFALEGNMWQQFSDRVPADDGTILKCKAPCPTPSGPVMPTSVQRFTQQRLDKLGVSMDVATGGTTLILYSWDNTIVRLAPTCENGMFYGYGDGKLYAMTGRVTRPLPTPRPLPSFP